MLLGVNEVRKKMNKALISLRSFELEESAPLLFAISVCLSNFCHAFSYN